MGKVASLFISKTFQRVVVLRGRGEKFRVEFVDKGLDLLERYSTGSFYISIDYPELISETVEIPPVKDEDTKLVLIKKQLLDRLGISEDMFVIYREDEEESTPQKRVLRVFALPKSISSEDGLVPEEILRGSEFFTTCQFSLAGVSKLVSPDLTVFHVFSEGENLTMTVSSGDDVLYTRTLPVPPYAKEVGFEDFVHENVNMTYMFVAQRSNIPVDLLLLSGILADSEELARGLAEVISTGIAVPIPSDIFSGIDGKTYNEFLPCFGTPLLPDSYDFSPPEVKERRSFNSILSRTIPVLLTLFLLFLPLLGMRLYEIYSTSRSVSELVQLLRVQTSGILKDPLLKREVFNYYLNYIHALDSTRAGNPLNMLKDMEPLLRIANAKTYVLGKENRTLTLYMEIERSFPRLIDMTLYREKLFKVLEGLSSKGYTYKINSEVKDLKDNRLSIKLSVERKI